jgi:hypothetical protein
MFTRQIIKWKMVVLIVSLCAASATVLFQFRIPTQDSDPGVAGTEIAPVVTDLSAVSDAELLKISKAFRNLDVAFKMGPRYDSQVAERLIELIRSREDLDLSAEEMHNLVRWVATYKGPESTKLLIELLERPLKPVISLADIDLIYACQTGLGYEDATIEGLEYLKKMTTEEYWLARDFQPQCPDFAETMRSPSGLRKGLRASAFGCFYLSGSDYALRAIKNGECVPLDAVGSAELQYAIKFCEACLRGERPKRNVTQ